MAHACHQALKSCEGGSWVQASLGYIVEAFREKGGKRHIDKARETERKQIKICWCALDHIIKK